MSIVYLGLGSNLGDREKNINAAISMLEENAVKVIKRSSIIETEPINCPKGSGKFLNASVKAITRLPPQSLLSTILSIESSLGRVRKGKNSPRTIDIDILYYENFSISTPLLTIPHPRIKERPFVIKTLNEIGYKENISSAYENN